jgi:peptidoglycan/LPS O-acetylase OafA/YrhL
MDLRRDTWPPQAADSPAKNPIQLDSRDSTILKALAISAIVFHNFFHAVSLEPENEFGFRPGSFAVFLETVRHPSLSVQAVFSFFGYLGVPVFIFLSAYGLAKSHWDGDESWMQFMAGRVGKLFPIFGLVILPWLLGMLVQVGVNSFVHSVLPRTALMLMGLTPLIPGQGLPPVGPWWFIPFILEFYAIFFLLRAVTKRFGWRGLLVLALLSVVVSAPAGPWLAQWKIYLYATPLGRLPSLCLGIAVARYPIRFPVWLAVAAGGVMVLGNEYALLWPMASTAAVVVAVWVYLSLRERLRDSRVLERVGRYSVLIFLLNGFVRNDFLGYATTPMRQLVFGAMSALTSYAIAAMIQEWLISRRRRTRATAPRESELAA